MLHRRLPKKISSPAEQRLFPLSAYSQSFKKCVFSGSQRWLSTIPPQTLIKRSVWQHPVGMRFPPFFHCVTNAFLPAPAIPLYPLLIEDTLFKKPFHWTDGVPFAFNFSRALIGHDFTVPAALLSNFACVATKSSGKTISLMHHDPYGDKQKKKNKRREADKSIRSTPSFTLSATACYFFFASSSARRFCIPANWSSRYSAWPFSMSVCCSLVGGVGTPAYGGA